MNYDKIILELLSRVQSLEEEMAVMKLSISEKKYQRMGRVGQRPETLQSRNFRSAFQTTLLKKHPEYMAVAYRFIFQLVSSRILSNFIIAECTMEVTVGTS